MIKIAARGVTKEDAFCFDIVYRMDGDRAMPAEQGEEGAEVLKVWIRPLLGRDTREINNSVLETDKRGKTATLAGDIPMLKVCRSVVHVEGNIVDAQERPITRWTQAVYDGVEQWINDRILEQVDAINQELAEGE